MRVIFYSVKGFEKQFLQSAGSSRHDITLTAERLTVDTLTLAIGHEAVVVFTGDDVSAAVIAGLQHLHIRFIAIRATGYDNVDIQAASAAGIRCANVPDYSPNAIAEHAVALMLCLNRKLVRANSQVHAHNFLVDDLVGFDMLGKTVGIVGAGRIGSVLAGILHGFGCRLLAYDRRRDEALIRRYGVRYVELEELCSLADIISLHTPLNNSTRYLIGKESIDRMRRGVMLINTARGAVLDTREVIRGLEEGRIGALGIDVYEKEQGLFFHDMSKSAVTDEMLDRLLQFPNVLVTPHQAFATKEALTRIADTTYHNLDCWEKNIRTVNEIAADTADIL